MARVRGRSRARSRVCIRTVQVRLGERAQVWGAAGWGRGGLEITPESGAALEADLRNSMAAAGARAVLMGAGGLEIALRSDFLWTETSSDGTAALAEAVGTASRGRLMLEGAGPDPRARRRRASQGRGRCALRRRGRGDRTGIRGGRRDSTGLGDR